MKNRIKFGLMIKIRFFYRVLRPYLSDFIRCYPVKKIRSKDFRWNDNRCIITLTIGFLSDVFSWSQCNNGRVNKIFAIAGDDVIALLLLCRGADNGIFKI